MPTNKIRIPSAAMAGGLVFTGVTAVAIAHTGHAATRTAPAADTNSSPTVNLDNCPILAAGYHGGCVNQLAFWRRSCLAVPGTRLAAGLGG